MARAKFRKQGDEGFITFGDMAPAGKRRLLLRSEPVAHALHGEMRLSLVTGDILAGNVGQKLLLAIAFDVENNAGFRLLSRAAVAMSAYE